MKFKKNDDVKTRLAAGEIHSLTSQNISNTADQHRSSVIQRIESEFNIANAVAEWARDNMVTLLERSELTINFKAYELFKSTPSNSYQNVFERNTPRTGYTDTRDRTEQNLFKYGSIGSVVGIQSIIDRITKRGNYDNGSNRSFAPTIRPRYAALNIFGLSVGPAYQYGRSVIVLKEHVKHRCTFTFGDSFSYASDPNGSDRLGNSLHFDRILVDMDDRSFRCLYRKANNMPLQSFDLRGHRYIEAQIHSEVLFNRDVDLLRLSKQDLIAQANEEEVRNRAESIALFAIKNKIRVECIT